MPSLLPRKFQNSEQKTKSSVDPSRDWTYENLDWVFNPRKFYFGNLETGGCWLAAFNGPHNHSTTQVVVLNYTM